MNDDALTVDDLITGRAAEQMGPGVIPTAAVLVVQTMEEDGPGLRYVRTEGLPSWLAIGMMRSALLRIEDEDRQGWGGEPGELS